MTVMETTATPVRTTTSTKTATTARRTGASAATTIDAKTDVCASAPEAHPRPDGQDRYTISEVVAFTGLTAHTLRWYERIGLMPHIDRSHTGQRRYSNRDLDWLAFVGKLRLTGMPVADMVRYAELVREGDHTFHERQELLESTRRDVLSRIAELQDTLAVLDYKIQFYGGARPAPERA
ncbi:MerR family transcriptional regulator [Streptomyces himalayensis]|uniref:MerR family transcriptional regulator n=2 Tax=Streptomyces himalayensis TaxID=2820085 RepID=A0A7W2HHP2_9ACTN|nr:MerR family transcriptional regulator [Streptomyces himalayensis]MBA2948830.1 MerR family transcriptional regulator [Streptomyces himalayensis subsp. himalayensis]MBA4864225.1 MerR family transcriptional regulator [Streptomyces himalayensis subsp. aureolus]